MDRFLAVASSAKPGPSRPRDFREPRIVVGFVSVVAVAASNRYQGDFVRMTPPPMDHRAGRVSFVASVPTMRAVPTISRPLITGVGILELPPLAALTADDRHALRTNFRPKKFRPVKQLLIWPVLSPKAVFAESAVFLPFVS